MCSNCCGGFGPPIGCGGGCGCCSGLTFPCLFGASVNNPGCECCKEKPPKGMCQWPCMWPCCCQCKLPEFTFKPLEPKPVCGHCHKRTAHCPCRTRSQTKSSRSFFHFRARLFVFFRNRGKRLVTVFVNTLTLL